MTDTQILIADEAPWSEKVNAYDYAQFKLYLRLLDAVAANATDAKICKVLFNIDADAEPVRAQKCLQSHLKRARFMTEKGYLDLVRDTDPIPRAGKTDAQH
ncbi:MAG TPA: DUF2285 domain-containing protein [Rhizomicrobium sp.]